jgi:tRNA(Ile)-lysidine synthase
MRRLSGAAGGINALAVFTPLAEYRRLALAVSGGADSLALMLLAHRFATESGQGHDRFVVYSVDHGLRPEAAAEAAFAVREAQRLGFAARVLRWEGDKPSTGIQQAARLARYRLLAAAMAEDGAEALLTAHHLGDQAETVLMRLAHGSGVEGLRGMDYHSDIEGLTIIRPLLGMEPAELWHLVEAAGLEAISDPSNSDVDYERVRWRQAMPQLAALGLDARRLAKFADRMRDADRALLDMSSQAFAQVAVSADGAQAVIERSLLWQLPRAVAVRLVARTLAAVGGGTKPHALAAVEALTDRLIREPVRTTLHGCIVRSGRVSIRISREPGRLATVRKRSKEPSVS